MNETSYNFDLDLLLEILAEVAELDESTRQSLSEQTVDSTLEFVLRHRGTGSEFRIQSFMDDVDSPDVDFIGDEATIEQLEAFIDTNLGLD